jgi:hypothetical protein
MKKIVFFLLFSLLIVYSSQAQIRFGVKGGVNLSSVSVNDGNVIDKNVTGFHIGPSLEMLINDAFGLETSVLYSQKGVKFKDGKNTSTNKNGYLEIPVNLKYLFNVSNNFKPYALAGPYINFRVSGDDNFNTSYGNVKEQWKAKSFGTGLNFGAGVQMLNFLQFGVNYSLSLTNNYKTSHGDYSVKDRTWSIAAAILF